MDGKTRELQGLIGQQNAQVYISLYIVSYD
jgi:hypothetical protein